ncbi:glutathione S-transferase A [Octopus sinensis]|uniref:Glutathione S-transferase A n=1 Tax=Octopus sinensis TaxID=2607531 RepID=A0A6P7SAB4_9MOLL|nr:glutathione S-transferase A [Octopus sinensis]
MLSLSRDSESLPSFSSKSMMSDITLYWGSGSIPCWRIMITLEEKGLDYNSRLMSFEKKEHKSKEITTLNPRGQLPTMKVGDCVVNESFAACDYLETVYKDKGTSLYPPASSEKQLALVLQKMHETCNIQQKMVTNIIYYLWGNPNPDKDLLTKRHAELAEELVRWEDYMKELKSTFLTGPDITMADVMFFPYIAFGVRSGLQLESRYPCLAAYYNMMKERPSVKKSWPPHWKGTSNNNVLADV